MSWRFIPYAEFDGAMNMAIDVLLLERAQKSEPILRLYGFSPPCLSIGLSQKLPLETVERAKARGFQIVRRPSGGRAVLHFKDLTYAFVACEKASSENGILEQSVSAAYKQICAGLQASFQEFELQAELGSVEASYRHLADCFLATTNADLHLAGRKLAGSAQLRRRGSVLQHGSIPLSLEQDIMPQLLGVKLEAATEKTKRHANLFELLGRGLTTQEMNDAFRKGFSSAFSIDFVENPLSLEELEAAEKLAFEFKFDEQAQTA
ncbi:MAG: lipoate--protein ligase family protein [Candidatus Obscuribacterales bacterium]|nr:lipoate--protein ligase family protein [Candidatus Obscuribacterales bacterium]